MKKVILMLGAALLTVATVTSCKDNGEENGPDLATAAAGSYNVFIDATLGGAPAVADNPGTVTITKVTNTTVALALTGFQVMGAEIPVNIAEVGVSGTEANLALAYDGSLTAMGMEMSAKLAVTIVDKVLTGTITLVSDTLGEIKVTIKDKAADANLAETAAGVYDVKISYTMSGAPLGSDVPATLTMTANGTDKVDFALTDFTVEMLQMDLDISVEGVALTGTAAEVTLAYEGQIVSTMGELAGTIAGTVADGADLASTITVTVPGVGEIVVNMTGTKK
jgi:hypothetical protein